TYSFQRLRHQLLLPPGLSIFFMVASMAFFMLRVPGSDLAQRTRTIYSALGRPALFGPRSLAGVVEPSRLCLLNAGGDPDVHSLRIRRRHVHLAILSQKTSDRPGILHALDDARLVGNPQRSVDAACRRTEFEQERISRHGLELCDRLLPALIMRTSDDQHHK